MTARPVAPSKAIKREQRFGVSAPLNFVGGSFECVVTSDVIKFTRRIIRQKLNSNALFLLKINVCQLAARILKITFTFLTLTFKLFGQCLELTAVSL